MAPVPLCSWCARRTYRRIRSRCAPPRWLPSRSMGHPSLVSRIAGFVCAPPSLRHNRSLHRQQSTTGPSPWDSGILWRCSCLAWECPASRAAQQHASTRGLIHLRQYSLLHHQHKQQRQRSLAILPKRAVRSSRSLLNSLILGLIIIEQVALE